MLGQDGTLLGVVATSEATGMDKDAARTALTWSGGLPGRRQMALAGVFWTETKHGPDGAPWAHSTRHCPAWSLKITKAMVTRGDQIPGDRCSYRDSHLLPVLLGPPGISGPRPLPPRPVLAASCAGRLVSAETPLELDALPT